MRVRDGPAAVRGDAPPPRSHWPPGREGGGGGSPESEDLSRSSIAEPLAEGGFRCFVPRSLVVAAVCVLRSRASPAPPAGRPAQPTPFPVTITTPTGKVTVTKKPRRIVSLSPTATESLFAIGAGRQVIAVDDQSDYPKTAPKTTLSGFTPNVEAIARTGRISSSSPTTRRASSTRSPAEHPGHPSTTRRSSLAGGVPADPPARARHRQRVDGDASSSPRMKTRIARIVKASKVRAGGLSVYHELVARLLLGLVEDVRRQGLHAARAREHRGRGRRLLRHRLPAALGRVHRRGEPRT